MKLSILTPAVPSRIAQVEKLSLFLADQIRDLPVEHLVLLDNKRRTVGEKRDALLRAARGQYVAYVDDDDWVTPDYVASILHAIHDQPDVITFQQEAWVDDQRSIIQFKLGSENEGFKAGGITRRNAWHICAWRRTLAIQSRFPASNYGEDWAFAAPLCALPGLKEVHLPRILHIYRHSTTGTEAPPPR